MCSSCSWGFVLNNPSIVLAPSPPYSVGEIIENSMTVSFSRNSWFRFLGSAIVCWMHSLTNLPANSWVTRRLRQLQGRNDCITKDKGCARQYLMSCLIDRRSEKFSLPLTDTVSNMSASLSIPGIKAGIWTNYDANKGLDWRFIDNSSRLRKSSTSGHIYT